MTSATLQHQSCPRAAGLAPAQPAAPADPVLPQHASSLVAVRHLIALLSRPTLADRSSWALPVVAMAVVSALSLSVAGGVRFFFGLDGDEAGFYRVCAIVALVLLLIPLMTLAAAAARLSASRRDQRLSSLRLLGATSSTITLVTLAETAAVAFAGALFGVAGYVMLMPVFGLLHFTGRAIGAPALWLGILPIIAGVLGLTLLALVSSAIGLRKIVVSPLGVRTRAQAPRTSGVRAIIAMAFITAGVVLARGLGAAASELMVMVMGAAMLCLPLLALAMIGPWVISVIARFDLRRATTSVQLMAARATLENPKQLWRQIGALSLSVFVGVFVGLGLALASASSGDSSEAVLLADLRTGALLTLAISFVTVACSVGINQSAAVLDRRSLYVGLDMVGMPRQLIEKARRRAVMRPLMVVVLLSGGAALTLVLPLGLANQMANPVALMVCGAVVAFGVALVWLALLASHTTLRQVLRQGLVRSE